MEKRYRIDFFLLFSVIIVVLAGILTLYSQERIITEGGEGRWFKQTIFFIISLAVCLGVRKFNYQFMGGYALPFYLVCIVLLLLVLVPGIGKQINGARSWIRFGPVGFQPSELAKLGTIVLLAKYLELKEKDIDKIPALLMAFGITVIPMLLIVVQPDFGGALSLAPILLLMLFIAGADFYHISSVVVFFSVSLSIPLYIEYHKITLVDPLRDHLVDLGQKNLIPSVNILKTHIWNFIDGKTIAPHVAPVDKGYLTRLMGDEKLFAKLAEAADTVRYESGGFILRVIENQTLLIIVGSVLALAALTLFVIRFTQGTSMARLRRFYIPMGVLGISLLSAVAVQQTFSFKRYQVVRVTAFINPDKFPRDEAYHIRASKAAMGSGNLTGRGVFKGHMTMGERPLVPEAFTDFIYTSWGERTGFVGAVIILLLMVSIPLRGLQISFEARDRFGSLLAAGISSLFFYHIFSNAGIALGLLPVTGLPLSFMSYGGSHLLTCMIGVGILLSVHRRRFAN